jgi:hypothetical protein
MAAMASKAAKSANQSWLINGMKIGAGGKWKWNISSANENESSGMKSNQLKMAWRKCQRK